MEEENQKVENGRPLTNDEFSSNNFPEIPQQTHKQPENNVDFFDQWSNTSSFTPTHFPMF